MKIFFLLLLSVLFYGCSNITSPEQKDELSLEYITSFRQISTSSKASIQNDFIFVAANALVNGDLNQFIKHNITSYKILYRTVSVNGNSITASGLIIVPDTQEPAIISYQHGTITSNNQVPSLASNSNPEYSLIMRTLASAGYIVVVADYEGYGETDFLEPPYMHVHSNSKVSIDMINAAIEFLDYKEINHKNKLSISGYSEGAGYALKMGELINATSFDGLFEKIDIHAAAGAYHISAFTDSVLSSNSNLSYISTYIDVIESYNSVYNINNSWDYYINEDYVELVASDRSNIPTNPSLLFNESFISNYLSGNETELSNAFRDNSVHDLIIRHPVYLYHSRNDDFVPFYNSQFAYNNLNASRLELIEYENANHVETGVFFVKDFLEIKQRESEVIAQTKNILN